MNDVGVDVDAAVVAFLVMVSGLRFGLFGSDRIGLGKPRSLSQEMQTPAHNLLENDRHGEAVLLTKNSSFLIPSFCV